jgi:serine/threonine protein kinase
MGPLLDPASIKFSKAPVYKKRPVYTVRLSDGTIAVAKDMNGRRSIDPADLTSPVLPMDYIIGHCIKKERTYRIYRYCGNDLWALTNRIHDAYTSGELPPAIIVQFYIWTLNIMQALLNLHETGFRHTDIKADNIAIDKHGVATLIDCEGSRREGMPSKNITETHMIHDAEGKAVLTASRQNDFRGLAISILYLVVLKDILKKKEAFQKARESKDPTRIKRCYDDLLNFNETDYPLSYHPFITCAKGLADETDTAPNKLIRCHAMMLHCYLALSAEHPDYAVAEPSPRDNLCRMENIFFQPPTIDESTSCSIL